MVEVSIIVAAFNREDKIDNLIQNIWQASSGVEIEVILVDGSLNSNVKAVCEKYDFVRYVPNFNDQGPGHARSTGAKLALGDYIAFIDTDDEWLDGKIKHQLEEMKAKNLSFSYTQYDIVYPKYNKFFTRRPIGKFRFSTALIARGIALSTVMIKNDAYWQNTMAKFVFRGEDYYWWLNYLKSTGGEATCINIIGSRIYMSDDSLSKQRLRHHKEIFKYYRSLCGGIPLALITYLAYFAFAGFFKIKARILSSDCK